MLQILFSHVTDELIGGGDDNPNPRHNPSPDLGLTRSHRGRRLFANTVRQAYVAQVKALQSFS